MDNKLLRKEMQFEKSLEVRRASVEYIDQQFNVSDTVSELRQLMKAVTSAHINADTVNAACNCVSNMNTTIKTAISAARYLSANREHDE